MTALEQALKIFESTIREICDEFQKASDEPIPEGLPAYLNGHINSKKRLPKDHDILEPIINAHYEGEFDVYCQNDHLVGIHIAINSPEQMVIYTFTENFFQKKILFRIPGERCKYGQCYVFSYNNLVGALTNLAFNPSDNAENYAHWGVDNDPRWEKIIEFAPNQPSPYREVVRKAGGDEAMAKFDSNMMPHLNREECLAQIADMPQNIAETQIIGQLKIIWQTNLVGLAEHLCGAELSLVLS